MEREKMNKEITALYCRLSKEDKQSGESMSISTQKEMLMDYARQNGFRNCRYYVDAPDIIGLKQNPTKRASL